MNITWILHALAVLFGIIATACGLLSSSNKIVLFICFALVAGIFELTIPFLKAPQSFQLKPHKIENIILTFSFECNPLCIRTIWNNPYLINDIFEQVSDAEAIEIWNVHEKKESLTNSEQYIKLISRLATGPGDKKKAYIAKIAMNTRGYGEFIKKCNTQAVLTKIGNEIFNDWKLNFYISGEGKAYFVKETLNQEGIYKYYFYEYFGKQGRLQIIYHLPIANTKKLRNLSDLNGKIIEFKLRNVKYLNLTPLSLNIDFSEKHFGEDSEGWREGLTTKTIFFALDFDSKDWHDLPEWKRKHSLITKKEDGERIIWEGDYTIPNDFFRNTTIEK